MSPVDRRRIDVAIDACARALGVRPADARRMTVLRTLADEVRRILATPDASTPVVRYDPADSFDPDATPVRWPRRK